MLRLSPDSVVAQAYAEKLPQFVRREGNMVLIDDQALSPDRRLCETCGKLGCTDHKQASRYETDSVPIPENVQAEREHMRFVGVGWTFDPNNSR